MKQNNEYDNEPHMIRVACDGSSLGNPGPAGWAWYVSPELHGSGGVARSTNNIMELTAVAEALTSLPTDQPITLICDSRYVIDACTTWIHRWRRTGWKTAAGKPVSNQNLIMRIDTLMSARKEPTCWEWVRGHAGHPLNEAADTFARAQAELHARRR